MTAMSCAGNRRLGMKEHSGDVQGNSWYVGAIGNTVYTGVLITDLLKELGFNLDELQDKHLVAESLDIDVQGKNYSVSVPMSLVLDPLSEVIIAYEMNGEDIPIEHGYPLRLVVPGTVGVRNAKWVRALYVSDEEAKSTQQKENYKIVKEKDPKKIDYSQIKPIIGYVVNSAIADPVHKEVVTVSKENPYVTVRGYAVGNQTKGTPVDRVEVSLDGGKTWNRSTIISKEDKEPGKKVFSWVLWEYTINAIENANSDGRVTVTCKCYDTEGTT
jgi:sulfite oxidase